MKKITVTLSDKAEKQFNEIMYSLPREEDGSGMCTQSQAISHALESQAEMEHNEAILHGCYATDSPLEDLLHKFFNSKSDASPIFAEDQEELEKRFKEWVKTISWRIGY